MWREGWEKEKQERVRGGREKEGSYCLLFFILSVSISLLQGSPHIEKMQRVLEIYARRNKHIGYCQSMNYIVGMLLLLVEEEGEEN